MKERIAQIMAKENMNALQFAKETNIQQASLSHILNGRNNASLDIIKRIHQRFPNLSWDWLMDGTGDMYISSTPQPPISKPTESKEYTIDWQANLEYDKENEVKAPVEPPKEIVRETVKYVEKAPRKVTEIRIFFDDGTFEVLFPPK